MFDTTLLQRGKRYRFRTQNLTYCHSGADIPTTFTFKTDKGNWKVISQKLCQQELSELEPEIKSEAIAAPVKD